MRRLVIALLAAITLALLGAAAGLGVAHVAIRRVRPPLPGPEALLQAEAQLQADGVTERPVAVHVIDTAQQAMPRAAVLDASRDPNPDAAYRMSHPAFVLAWPDGRLFLIDAGMPRDDALAFGAPLERLAAASPIVPLAALVDQLGSDVLRVRGIAFTHLHTDHTAGAADVCRALGRPLRLFQTPAQADHGNHTTWAGRAQLESAGCLVPERLSSGPLYAVPGFPGLFVLAAAGHTPGSQIFIAHVRGAEPRVWIFTGDAVNHRDGVRFDVAKPALYSALLVPEDGARLARLRGWLGALAAFPGVELAISHDLAGIETRGMPPWPGPAEPPR